MTSAGLTPPLITLIVLARAPEHGVVKTRLARDIGKTQAMAVYCTLLARTAQMLHGWKGPVEIHFAGASTALDGSPLARFRRVPQINGTMAERLHAAVAPHLDAGRAAIAIGSDCPDLTAGHLAHLVALLDHHPIAFGPTRDGGYWGVALRDAHALTLCCANDLPWSTSSMLAHTRQRLAAHGITTGEGARLEDIDEVADLQRARERGAMPQENPRLTIVVLVLNEVITLGACLDHLREVAPPAEVLVIDGCSHDGSLQVALAHPLQPQVRSVAGGRHRQVNAALELAQGDYVLLLSVDVRLPSAAITRLLTVLAREQPRAGCLRRHASSRSSFHRWLDRWGIIRAAWTAGGYLDQVPFFLRTAALERGGARDQGPYDSADLGRRLARHRGFLQVGIPAVASCRAYHRHGSLALTLMHQRLRAHNFLRQALPWMAARR